MRTTEPEEGPCAGCLSVGVDRGRHGMRMKAAVYYGPRDIRVEEVPEPTPGSTEAKIAIAAAGICGSDMHPYRGASHELVDRMRGRILGHEVSGTVVEVGRDVTEVKIGDRVSVEPLVGCGYCRFCRSGRYHLCRELQHIGGARPGGFAEYTIAPQSKLYKLPDSVSFSEGALLDCLAVGVHAVHRVPPDVRHTVAIVGAGTIGLSILEVVRVMGATTVVVDTLSAPLEMAKDLGADHVICSSEADPAEALSVLTGGRKADVVYEAVGGSGGTFATSLDLVGRGGTVGVVGSFQRPLELPPWESLIREITVRFIWSYANWGADPEFQIALDLLSRGRLDASALITHRVPLERICDGFEVMDRKHETGAMKVLVIP